VQCIFWLSGLAGTGKSTISRTVARRYSEQKRLGASFFFSKGDGDVSHAGKFFTSLALQLAKSIPSLQKQICDAIVKQSDVANLSLLDQWRQLILGPLSRLKERQQSYVLVIDALDECESDNNVQIILKFLAEARSLETVRLRVFLTSRPEVPICGNKGNHG
jgi:archaellum biogenesis ATPase FlaH